MAQASPAVGERTHIAFFGMRNAGKSSVVNAVTGQSVSIVSDVKGTTTDPVRKSMELLPLGPVVIIDTPGIDDEGELGSLRVKTTLRTLEKTDIAVLVIDAAKGESREDGKLIDIFRKKEIPFLKVMNKADLLASIPEAGENEIYVSAMKKEGTEEIKNRIAGLMKHEKDDRHIVADLIEPGDMVVLVVPIDESAPKGRLILPQQQTIRDILERGAYCTVTKDTELRDVFSRFSEKPKMVITDSQAFGRVNKDTPDDILLTSFSILMARYKGGLREAVKGAFTLDRLKDGDKVLISEGCTHHRQCGDIGTVKLPAWIRNHTKKEIEFSFTSGGDYPEDLSEYALVIHCGACMLNDREMKSRVRRTQDSGTPITNYGIAIAHLHGILERSLSPFPELVKELRGN